jgi:small ligand-binding sensory domain FIST
MATVVDQARDLTKHLRDAAAAARRIRLAAQAAAPSSQKQEPAIDPLAFRRLGV